MTWNCFSDEHYLVPGLNKNYFWLINLDNLWGKEYTITVINNPKYLDLIYIDTDNSLIVWLFFCNPFKKCTYMWVTWIININNKQEYFVSEYQFWGCQYLQIKQTMLSNSKTEASVSKCVLLHNNLLFFFSIKNVAVLLFYLYFI